MYALASLGLRRSAGDFCVAGVGLGAIGQMYAVGLLGLRRSAGRFCVAGAALGALPRGRMYAVASLGLRRSAGGVCVAGAGSGGFQCSISKHVYAHAYLFILKAFCCQEIW